MMSIQFISSIALIIVGFIIILLVYLRMRSRRTTTNVPLTPEGIKTQQRAAGNFAMGSIAGGLIILFGIVRLVQALLK